MHIDCLFNELARSILNTDPDLNIFDQDEKALKNVSVCNIPFPRPKSPNF